MFSTSSEMKRANEAPELTGAALLVFEWQDRFATALLRRRSVSGAIGSARGWALA
jgi:hypothetical protein